jgi:hypothetical protein
MDYYTADKKTSVLPTDTDYADSDAKDDLNFPHEASNKGRRILKRFLVVLVLYGLAKLTFRFVFGYRDEQHWHTHRWFEDAAPICPQTTALVPTQPIAKHLRELYVTDGFKQKAIRWLSEAVKVPYVLSLIRAN